MVCVHSEHQNQGSFYPYVLLEISVLNELPLGPFSQERIFQCSTAALKADRHFFKCAGLYLKLP